MERTPRLRPLLARPGARYGCVRDGFCCGDVHSIGPLRAADLVLLKRSAPGSFRLEPEVDQQVMRTTPNGDCVCLDRGACALHAAAGAHGKPMVCRRYPFTLVATPEGGRVGTAHRCPCRTMGERPLVDLAEADLSLRDHGGRLRANARAPMRISISRRQRVSFGTYVGLETPLLERLAAGEAPLSVLGTEPALPALDSTTWAQVGRHFVDRAGGPRQSARIMAWFGSALLALSSDRELAPDHGRPWKAAFDRAEARAPVPRAPRDVIADWLADLVWGMLWVDAASFDVMRAEWTAKLLVVDLLARSLVSGGARPDRAAAEALLVVEVSTSLPDWVAVVSALRPAPPLPWKSLFPAHDRNGANAESTQFGKST